MTTPAAHALNTPPWQRVETTMMSAARDIRVAYDHCFEPLGLNLSQASAIGYVHENGPMTQTQLAAALVLGKAATGTLVDHLEGRGLVRRVPNAQDRRVWLVENTDDGAEMAIRIVEVDRQLRARLRAGISSDERRNLADLLMRMSANAQEALAEAAQVETPVAASGEPAQ